MSTLCSVEASSSGGRVGKREEGGRREGGRREGGRREEGGREEGGGREGGGRREEGGRGGGREEGYDTHVHMMTSTKGCGGVVRDDGVPLYGQS